jgi:hypothetical protein
MQELALYSRRAVSPVKGGAVLPERRRSVAAYTDFVDVGGFQQNLGRLVLPASHQSELLHAASKSLQQATLPYG